MDYNPVSTKNRITACAHALFNRDGLGNVSSRQLATEIGISHSNLAYHFKSKSDILHALYTQMEEEMDNVVFPEGDLSLRHYNWLLIQISRFQKKYEFFYMDMLVIAREYPDVIARYRETISRRSDEYEGLIRHYIRKKLIKKEHQRGYYRSLFHSIWVMSTFWLQQKRILGTDHPLIRSGSDINHVWEILIPCLTRKGLKEYVTFSRRSDSRRPIERMYLDQLN